MKKKLEFFFTTKEILNSNSMPNHFFVKSKMVNNIRDEAIQEGLLHHSKENLPKVEKNLERIETKRDVKAAKSRKTKTLNKWKKGSLTTKELIEVGLEYGLIENPKPRTYVFEDIELGTSKAKAGEYLKTNTEIYENFFKKLGEELEKDFENSSEKTFGDEPEFLFDLFKITITVFAPTRRRFDPPNIYPTVKALIDGLTDVCWWSDDDFEHLLEMSFRYGGLSGNKNYKVVLDIEEIVDTDDFQTESEIAGKTLFSK